MKLIIDGKLKEQNKTVIDTGFFYGFGLFETIYVREGRAVLLQPHLNRLNSGLSALAITKAVQVQEVEQAIAMLRCYNGSLKVNVSEEHVVFSVREVAYPQEMYGQGVSLTLSDVRRNATSPLVFMKTMNYMENILEVRRAKKAGFHDALFMNHNRQICETGMANIFFIRNGRLMTPEVKSGLLPGIIRGWLIDAALVEERTIDYSELEEMDSVFITNSLMGLMRVSGIDGHSYEDHPLIHELTRAYVAMLQREDL